MSISNDVLNQIYEFYPNLKESKAFAKAVTGYVKLMDNALTEISRRVSIEEERQ